MNKKEFETLCNKQGYETREKKSTWIVYQALIELNDDGIKTPISWESLRLNCQLGSVNTVKLAVQRLLAMNIINDNWELLE